MFEYKGVKISWLGHDCFKIKNDKIIYIDPFNIKEGEKADIIFVTHEHYDHCSPKDIKKISTSETMVVAPESCKTQLSGMKKTKLVKPGDKIIVEGVEVEVVPAYNINKFKAPGEVFHPKEEGKVGYIITLNGVKIYHAGDTDLIQEMKNIQVDVALLPVSGTYVMTAEEAAEATKIIKTEVAIPMHYGSIVGDEKDAEKFKKIASCKVEILKKEDK
ncbi:MAG: MBL fold metallo-hydrolase [Candidatus Bathyarchaeia archaeon]|nr:MBL fold metallo-hydrolase [Candidatus Bathyarchaeota archaeon]